MKCRDLTPTGWFVLLSLPALAMSLTVPWHLSVWISPFYATLAGLVTLCVSGVAAFLAQRAFQRHHTPYAPDAQPIFLLEHGIYAISRNPVYLALVLAMGGLGGILDSVWLPIASIVLWKLLDRCVVPFEEQRLLDIFGTDYERYKALTHRWL